MRETLFFRVLAQADKAAALAGAVQALGAGAADERVVYAADPRTFGVVPTSPFAYWVSDRVRRLFAELPPFEGEGRTVKQGVATANDFRFVRAWWEVAPSRLLDGANGPRGDIETSQAWCRERTHQGKRWAPFAKGGAYAPFYADVHLVVNWEYEGEEMKAWAITLPGTTHWSRRIASYDYYFRPGLTWPLRTAGLSFRALPAGCVFGHKGPCLFVGGDDSMALGPLAALTNSVPFKYLMSLLVARVSLAQAYEVGIMKLIPLPILGASQVGMLSEIASACVVLKRGLDQADETTHVFTAPAALLVPGAPLMERAGAWGRHQEEAEQELRRNQAEIDALSYRLYGLSQADRQAMEGAMNRGADTADAPAGDEDENDEEEEEGPAATAERDGYVPALVSRLLSYAVGCAFGRWDVRIGGDSSLAPQLAGPFDPLPVCAPGALVGPDGLPATSGRIVSEAWLRVRPDVLTLPVEGTVSEPIIPDGAYPLDVAWDGVLVDDEGHPRDVVARLRAVLEVLWGEQAERIEREACELLGVRSLREYLRNPRGFWDDHVKRYAKSRRKAPIYWLLPSRKRSYGLWLYYHRLDSHLLAHVLSQYVGPKVHLEAGRLDDLRARKEQVGASRPAARKAEGEIARQEELIAEIKDFHDRLQRAADLGLRPDLDDGVVLNAAPLGELMPWKEPRSYWEELRRGKYAWSSLGQQLRAKGLVASHA